MNRYQPDNLQAPDEYRNVLLRAYNIIVNQIGSLANLEVDDVLPKIGEEFVGVKPTRNEAPKLHDYITGDMGWTREDAKEYFYGNVKTSDFLLIATLGDDEAMVKEMQAANQKAIAEDAKV